MSNFRSVLPYWLAAVLLIFCSLQVLDAQNLSFTHPEMFVPNAQTDKAIDITNFKGNYFVTWKEEGAVGNIRFSYLGKQYDTATISTETVVPNAQSAFAPVLRPMENRLYLFWISKEGGLKYIISSSDTGFNTANVYEVQFTNPLKLSKGVTAGKVKESIVIGSHADNKNQLLYCVLLAGPDGRFFETAAMLVNNEVSADYPFVVGLNPTTARFSWRSKGDDVSYADYNVNNSTWTKATSLMAAKTKAAPAVYRVWGENRLFYIWRGNKNDTRLYYALATDTAQPVKQIALPAFFSTNQPVSITSIDSNNFIMAYTGADNHLYLCNFSQYDPASWMQQVLSPLKSNKTLRDIVMPGAHDAAMNILNGVGGQQKGTINACNTLTQKLTIEQQLNAGIRMFDLRAGTYQHQLYAKHCSSDCMEDALGGGYGEKLKDVAVGIKRFLQKNRQEIVILTFSHFCEKETPLAGLKDSLLKNIGKDLVYSAGATSIGEVPLSKLAGKVIISFEMENNSDNQFPANSIAAQSKAFINFRREYAATNNIKVLLAKEQQFFLSLKEGVQQNDIIRLDWQITQTADEAPMICNDFEDENLSPVVNGLMLLANAARKHKSIIDHSLEANKYLPVTVTGWINDGIINKKNKPNILYVDVAGGWITDYCIDLNKTDLYR